MSLLLSLALLAQAAVQSDPALAPQPNAPAVEAVVVSAPDAAVHPPDLSYASGGTANTAAVEHSMREYFAGEKREAWAWLGVGLAAATSSAIMGSSSSDAARGASFPLIDISVVQLGAAAWLLWRTDSQVDRLSAQLASAPCAFFAEEPARMARVQLRFAIALPIEATSLVAGASMMGIGFTGKHDFLAGAGLGLIAQSVVVLVFDQFAAARAVEYDRDLQIAARASAHSCSQSAPEKNPVTNSDAAH